MGFFRRLFGLNDPDNPFDQLTASIDRSATLLSAPHDDELWRQAEEAKGYDFAGDLDGYRGCNIMSGTGHESDRTL